MAEPATITITRGPARGQLFELSEELVHIGRADSNQVVLPDPDLAEHQASIVRRNGRYAIFPPLPDAVSIDGSRIPPQRWVWLPDVADIELGQRTSLRFSMLPAEAESEAAAEAVAGSGENGTPAPAPAPRTRKGRRGRRRKRQLARFVTDDSGGARVQLGEDGQLPELALDEDLTGGRPARGTRTSNNLLLYVLLAVSVASTAMLLLVEAPGSAGGETDQAQARDELKQILHDSRPKKGATESAWRTLVRESLAAGSRQDRAGELRAFDRLLELLNAEDIRQTSTGLTGDKGRDKTLRTLIARLIRN